MDALARARDQWATAQVNDMEGYYALMVTKALWEKQRPRPDGLRRYRGVNVYVVDEPGDVAWVVRVCGEVMPDEPAST
jgi:hypothetical protein